MEGKSYFAARSPGSRLSCCQLGKERPRATTNLPPEPNNTAASHMKSQCLLGRNQYHTTAWMDARTIKLDTGLVVHREHPLNAETSVPALMGGEAFALPAHPQPIVGGVDIRNLEMITYIEAAVRHDYAAHQRRHRRFGVERVGTMNNKPRVDSVL